MMSEAEEFQFEKAKRDLTGTVRQLFRVVAIAMSLFHLYTAYFGVLEAMQQRAIHLFFALCLIFLLYPSYKKAKAKNITYIDIVMILGSLASCGYIFLTVRWLRTSTIGAPGVHEQILGIILILLVLEATRRSIGLAMPVIAVIALAYAYLGSHLPGILNHRGYSISQIVFQMYCYEEGIFTTPLGVSATYVIMFMIFGAFLQVSGAGQFFINAASGLLGFVRGGPAKIAIIASSLFGTISGAAVANVASTGTFTIPLMKKTGYQPAFAGAVESVASTGGQIMPPVMGAAAFVIAEILGVSYIEVMIAALLPALLYYLSLFIQVDLEAARKGLKGLPRKELPNFWQVMRREWYLLVPPVVLIYLLSIAYSTMKAAFWSIVVLLFVCAFRKETRINFSRLFTALEEGAKACLVVASACACAGLVVGVFTLTGLGLRISSMLISLSGGNLIALLVLTAVAALILGMGLPTVGAYLVLAVTVAPALVEIGVKPMAAHLFIFYFGTISCITPPVAIAAYAGAAIAKASPWKVGWIATRLGIVAFLIPFMFAISPALLFDGSIKDILLATATSLIGVGTLATGLAGYLLSKLNIPVRVIFILGSVMLIKPGLTTDIIGIGLISIGLILALFGYKKERAQKNEVAPLDDSRVTSVR